MKLEDLDLWINKLQRSNKPLHLPPLLYSQIRSYVRDAFMYDFNILIEEYDFYNQIPPKMQTIIINSIFWDFKRFFKHFFEQCENGFTNELIINMYCRIYEPDSDIVKYGNKFSELYFIQDGGVSLYNKYLFTDFMFLP